MSAAERWLQTVFWISVGLSLYAYVVYPLLVSLLARLFGRPIQLATGRARKLPSVSVVIVAYNEEASIGRRIQEFLAAIEKAGAAGEVIIVSDGSSDGTARVARASSDSRVRVIELPVNQGKAVGLSEGCAAAAHPIVVLADARQRWDEDALRFLLEDFADPSVGAVSGELILESQAGVIAGVGLYWRYEKWIRKAESRLHSTAGLTGAICAVRRWLFRPVPAGTVLDDVYWPMRVVLQGSRVVFDGRARAFDRLPDRPRDEFRRKVRTLAGNYQLVGLLPRSVVPWRNPIWWQFVSHKLLRLVVPWALIAALLSSFPLEGPIFQSAFWCQVALYGLGVIGLNRGWIGRRRLPAAAGSFLVLNAAAWVAFWVWLTGRTSRSWRKVAYESGPQEGVPASSDELNVGV